MFYRVPFRCSRRVMTNVDCESFLICPTLKFRFPKASAMSVAAATVRFDHNFSSLPKAFTPLAMPPTPNRTHRELRRIRRGSNTDVSVLIRDIVDAIRYRATVGIAGEVIHSDFVRLLAPRLPAILEIADKLCFLSVNADDRQSVFLKSLSIFWIWRNCRSRSGCGFPEILFTLTRKAYPKFFKIPRTVS